MKGYAPPYSLELNPTFRCNLDCIFCNGAQYGVTRERRKELSDRECHDLIRQAGLLGVRELRLAGDGEPLLRNDLAVSLIREAGRVGMRGFLTTNGTLLTAEVIEAMVRSRWIHVSISIDAPGAEDYDTVTGTTGMFGRLMANIEALKEAKRKSRRLGPWLHINTVLFRNTYDKLPEMVALARDLGIPSISFEPLVKSPPIAHLELGPDEIEELPRYVREAERLARAVRISTNVGGLLEPGLVVERDMGGLLVDGIEEAASSDSQVGEKPSCQPGEEHPLDLAALPCFQPWSRIVVRPDGAAYPCCNFYDAGAENVRSQGLEGVWTGAYFNRVREGISAGALPAECEKCNEWLLRENRVLREALRGPFILPAYLRHLAGRLARHSFGGG